MVYFRNFDSNPTIVPFDTWLLEGEGRGLVSASNNLSSDAIYVRTPRGKPWYKASVSVVICTYGRPASLDATLYSLIHQTFKQFEIILVTEKGNLAELRDKGLRCAEGDIVSLIDDDVYCPPTWLQSVVETFQKKGVVGVTGPTTVTVSFKSNRDIFKYKRIRKWHDSFFKVPATPGHLSECGAPSMASNDEPCDYEGRVEYLECCNMSVKKKEAIDAGGFDHNYIRTSEWCEVDLALKLNQKGIHFFSPRCRLYHRPSKVGIYKERLSTDHRWKNFNYFQQKWVKPSFKTYTYRAFIWAYLKMKEWRMI